MRAPPSIGLRNDARRRLVSIGGLTKTELLERLRDNSMALNKYAEVLFACDAFTTAESRSEVSTVELTVDELGFPQGATLAKVFATAIARGLGYCPLEVAPQLRLLYVDQPERAIGFPPRPNQSPSGALVVASEPLSERDNFPRGFYLRRIEGVLWLRGYCSPADHFHAADDQFLFREHEAVVSIDSK